MGNITSKTISLVASGMLIATAAPTTTAWAEQSTVDDVPSKVSDQKSQDTVDAAVKVADLHGSFSYNQGISMNNEMLRHVLYRASDVLCGAMGTEVAPTGYSVGMIKVSGDVEQTFTASIEDFQKKYPVAKIMGCTCAANPADGLASANADVSGIRLAGLIKEANPDKSVNTITFISEDGYTVSLPYSYVMQRFAILVTTVNGQDMQDALGCSNQLWLGSVSARHFAQNVVAIQLSYEQTPPPVPGQASDMALPSVGITEGW